MTAATTLARARVSRHLGLLIALGAVAGVVGAVVVATLIGAQRTRTAMDRLVDAANYPAAQVRAYQPGPELEQIASLPEVAQRWDGVLPIGRVLDTADWFYPSMLVARLTHLGAEPAAVVGARMATEPGRGRTAVPVRATLVGVTATVVGLVAIATFQHSVVRTTTVPARFGVPADYTVEVARDDLGAMVDDLEDWPELAAVGVPFSTSLTVDGTFTYGFAIEALRGVFPPPLLSGRAPDRPDELAAGPSLLRQLDLEIGDRVTVSGDNGDPLDFLLVGTALAPTVQSDDYAGQVWTTADGLRRVAPDPEILEVSLRYAPGTDRADVARRLDVAYPAGVTDESPPPVPGPLVTLRDTEGLVRALSVFLTFLMLALTANALLAGVRNRAPDLAIVRSLGFSSRQTTRSILWMSTTTVGLGLAVGIPLGLVLGAVVWRRVAGSLDIGRDMAAPWWFLAVLTVAMLIAAGVLALIPARRAARLRPVEVLRAE